MVTVKGNNNDIIAAHVRMGIGELQTILTAIETNDIVFNREFDERLRKISSMFEALRRIMQERRFR